ncbi:MAG: hypothetical protein KKG00_05590 [Bacteroidetes bacterium]|nr:hypothetical protein [Bacteroidota bacterium]
MSTKKYTCLLLFLLLFGISAGTCLAQPDSVIISGRILNLTPALYRQAPSITFTRNNILQPQTELTRQAPLQADGTFRVAMPLLYPQEEVYLDYGGKVFTTFLAAPGELQLTFDADSMFVAKRLFYYAGVNAGANNQYMQYVMEEGRLMKDNKKYGENFLEGYFGSSVSEARRLLDRRADLRMSALLPLAQRGGVDPTLRKWVEAMIYEEQLSLLYEYALVNDISINQSSKDSLRRLTQGPMTFQRVQWVARLGDYADRVLDRNAYLNPNQARSLPVERVAALIKEYVKPLSAEEAVRLDGIIREGGASSSGVDFLASLYRRNRRTLDLVTMIEKKDKLYTSEFDQTTADLLDARLLVQQFYQLALPDQKILYNFLRDKITEPVFARSLEELYKLEVKDSTYIRLVQQRTDLSASPTEVLSGIWMAESDENGKAWFKKIQSLYENRTLYVIKWNLFDEASRNEILYAPALRAQLPADVEFLYIHLPAMDMMDSPDLWKKYIVRNKLKGVHLFLSNDQAVNLLFKLNPLASPSFSIMRPGGRYFTRNAPPPSNGQEAAQMLLKAREAR